MSHLLYHWRYDNYQRDLDMGVGFNLNQRSPKLHNIERGESLWAFTRAPDGRYVLVAELVCHHKTMNPPHFAYGPYRVWGDLKRSRYFSAKDQQDITELVRNFELATGRADSPLGRAFQGNAAVREIQPNEHLRLSARAQGCVLEPRACLLPEELLEREMYEFIEAYTHPPISKQRQYELTTKARIRRQDLVRELKELYGGRCQLTGWDPRAEYGRDLCEAHHIQWLSRGGSDTLDNLILISPNYHRLIHSADAPFDYQSQEFILPDRTLSIEQCEHIIMPHD